MQVFETLYVPIAPRSIHLMGGEITLLVPQEATGGRWSMMLFAMPAGLPGPVAHYHREMEETFSVLDGEVTMVVDGKELVCGAGESVVIRPGAVHRFWNSGGTTAKMIAHFTPGGFENYFDELAQIVNAATEWPPRDPRPLVELMERYDSPVVQA